MRDQLTAADKLHIDTLQVDSIEQFIADAGMDFLLLDLLADRDVQCSERMSRCIELEAAVISYLRERGVK